MGFRYVKGLGKREEEAFARAPGPYRDLEDFVQRTRLSDAALARLAEAGAFACFAPARRDAVWAAKALTVREEGELPLSDHLTIGPSLPRLTLGLEEPLPFEAKLQRERLPVLGRHLAHDAGDQSLEQRHPVRQ